MLRVFSRLLVAAIFVAGSIPQAFAVLADAGHRPFNADVPFADVGSGGSATPRQQFRTGTEATWTDNGSQTGISPANVTTRFYKVVVRLGRP